LSSYSDKKLNRLDKSKHPGKLCKNNNKAARKSVKEWFEKRSLSDSAGRKIRTERTEFKGILMVLKYLNIEVFREYITDDDTELLCHLNEGTGSTADDESANSNDLTLDGCSWKYGRMGYGVELNGSSDFMSVADDASLRPTLMTWEFAIEPDTSKAQMIVCKSDESTEGYTIKLNDSEKIVFTLYNGSSGTSLTSDTALSLNVFTHVACVFDGTTMKIYLDGVLESTTQAFDSENYVKSTNTLHIGCNNAEDDEFYDGKIDELRLSSVARTSFYIAHVKPFDNLVLKSDTNDKVSQATVSLFNMGNTLDWIVPNSHLAIYSGDTEATRVKKFGGKTKKPLSSGEKVQITASGYYEQLQRKRITGNYFNVEATDHIKNNLLADTDVITDDIDYVGLETERTSFFADTFPSAAEDNIATKTNVSCTAGAPDDPSDADSWTEDIETELMSDEGTEGEEWTNWQGAGDSAETSPKETGTYSLKVTKTSTAGWHSAIYRTMSESFLWDDFVKVTMRIRRPSGEFATATDCVSFVFLEGNNPVNDAYKGSIEIGAISADTWTTVTFTKEQMEIRGYYGNPAPSQEMPYMEFHIGKNDGAVGDYFYVDNICITTKTWDTGRHSGCVLSQEGTVVQEGSYSVKVTHRKVFFEDDFNDETPAGNPSKWTVSEPGSVSIYIDDGELVGGCNEWHRVKINDPDVANSGSISKTLAAAKTDDARIKFQWQSINSSKNGTVTFTLYDSTPQEILALRLSRDGAGNQVLEYKDNGGWDTADATLDTGGVWVTIDYDIGADTYAFTYETAIDGEQSESAINFVNAVANAEKVEFVTESGDQIEFVMDNFFWGTTSGGSDVNREVIYYASEDWNYDATDSEELTFHIRQDEADDDPILKLCKDASNYYYRTLAIASDDTWEEMNYEVGTGATGWSETGSMAWDQVNYIEFYWASTDTTVTVSYIDKLHFGTGGASYWDLDLAGDTTELFADDFDDETTGTDPDNWTVTEDGSTDIDIDAAIYYGGSGKSCRIYDNSGAGDCDMYKTITATSGLGYIELAWYVVSGNDCRFLIQTTSTNVMGVRITAAGNLEYWNGGWQSLSLGLSTSTWYVIKIVYDTHTQTYDLYLDDVLVLSSILFGNASATIDRLAIATSVATTCDVYIDSVSWYSIDETIESDRYFEDDFEDDSDGVDPVNWTVTQPASCTVEADDAQSKIGSLSCLVTDGNASANAFITKTLAASKTDRYGHVSFYFRVSSGDSGNFYMSICDSSNNEFTRFNYYDSGTDYLRFWDGSAWRTLLTPASTDTWYKIDIITDITTDTVHYYVNGNCRWVGGDTITSVANLQKIHFGGRFDDGDPAGSQGTYWIDHVSWKKQETHTLYEEDFEDVTVGNLPDNWTDNDGASCTTSVQSDQAADSSTKSLKFDDNNAAAICDVNSPALTYPFFGVIDIEFYIRKDGTTALYWTTKDSSPSTEVSMDFDTTENIEWHDGTSWVLVKNVSINTWYKLNMIYDVLTLDKGCVYVDDVIEMIMDDIRYAPTTDTSFMRFNTNTGATGDLWIDEMIWRGFVHYPGGAGGSGYETSGSLITRELTTIREAGTDFKDYFSEVKISVTETTPGTSTLTYKASSDGGSTWDTLTKDTYVELTDNHSDDPYGRTLEIKVEFAGDGTETPLFYDMTLDVKTKTIRVYDSKKYEDESLWDAIRDVLYEASLEGRDDGNAVYQLTYRKDTTNPEGGETYLRQSYEIIENPIKKQSTLEMLNSQKVKGAAEGVFTKKELDQWTEQDASSWTGTNVTLTDVTTAEYLKEGSYLLKGVLSLTSGWFDPCDNASVSTTYFDQTTYGDNTITETTFIRVACGDYPSHYAVLDLDTVYELSGNFDISFDVRTDDAKLEAPICALVTSAPLTGTVGYLDDNVDYLKFDDADKIKLCRAGASRETLKTGCRVDTWYTIRIKRVSTTHTIWIDGEKVWSGTTIVDNDHDNIQWGDFRTSEGETSINIDYRNFGYSVTADGGNALSPEFSDAVTKNLDKRENLVAWYLQDGAGSFAIRLETSASDYYSRTITPTKINEMYELKLPVGSKAAGWTSTGSPSWNDIKQVRFVYAASVDVSVFYLDKLHFTVKDIEFTYEDATSISANGTYEGKVIYDKQLYIVEECRVRAKTLVDLRSAVHNPIEISVYGRDDIDVGDVVKVDWSTDGIDDEYFRVDEIHQQILPAHITKLFLRDVDEFKFIKYLDLLNKETKQVE
jgi:hypothetical protein